MFGKTSSWDLASFTAAATYLNANVSPTIYTAVIKSYTEKECTKKKNRREDSGRVLSTACVSVDFKDHHFAHCVCVLLSQEKKLPLIKKMKQ